MALIWTLAFGFIGELACLSGLKFRITDMILLEMDWRVRKSVPRQFKVAVIDRASLDTEYSGMVSTTTTGLYLPVLFLEDIEESVQQPRCLGFQLRWWYHWVISGNYSERDLVVLGSLYTWISRHSTFLLYCKSRTLGSGITPGVCTWMIFCTNLMQHMRTPAGPVSHLLSIFDFIHAIWFQIGTSCGFATLVESAS